MNPFFIPTDKFRVEADMYFHPSNRYRYGSAAHTTWKVKRKVFILGIPIWLWYGTKDNYAFTLPCRASKFFQFRWEDDEFQKMVKPFKKNNYSNVKQVFFKRKW